jgi:DUF2971 family protein
MVTSRSRRRGGDNQLATRMDRPKNWLHDRESFFKYMAPDAALKVLNSSSLRWSSPDSFNDPFDMGFDLHVDIDHARVRKLTLKSLWDAHYSSEEVPAGNDFGRLIRASKGTFPKLPREEFDLQFAEGIDESLRKLPSLIDEFNPVFQKAMKEAKVLCLSERNDSILMWSHYGQMHQGVVFELACVPERDSVWGAAMPVKYGDMPPIYDDDFLIRLGSGQVSIDPNVVIKNFVTAKAADWSYEREWRIVLHFEDPSHPTRDIRFSPEELAAVYLGCRMSHNNKEEIAAKIRHDYPRAKIFAAERLERKFALRFREY